MLHRRGFLLGLGAGLITAPAIVRAASLMPVRGIIMPTEPAYMRGVVAAYDKSTITLTVSILNEDGGVLVPCTFGGRQTVTFITGEQYVIGEPILVRAA